MGKERQTTGESGGRMGFPWKGAAISLLVLFLLLDFLQLASSRRGNREAREKEGKVFLLRETGPGEGGKRLELLPPSARLSPGDYTLHLLVRAGGGTGWETLGVRAGKVSLSLSGEGRSFPGRSLVLWKGGGGGKGRLAVRCDFGAFPGLKEGSPWGRVRAFLRFRDLFPGNPCRLGEEVDLLLPGGERERAILRGVSGLARRGVLLWKERVAGTTPRKKGAAYLVRRELGLPSREGWVFAKDGPLTILQRRMNLPLDRLGWMRLVLDPRALLERVNLRTGGGMFSAGRIVSWASLPREVFPGGKETVLEIDLSGPPLRGKSGGKGLSEVVLGLRGAPSRVLGEGWVREVAFFGAPRKGGARRAEASRIRGRLEGGEMGWRILTWEPPVPIRGAVFSFRPGRAGGPSGVALGQCGIRLEKPFRAPSLFWSSLFSPGRGGGPAEPGGEGLLPWRRTEAFLLPGAGRISRAFSPGWAGRGGPPLEGEIGEEKTGPGKTGFTWLLGKTIQGKQLYLRFEGGSLAPLGEVVPAMGSLRGKPVRFRGREPLLLAGPFDRLHFLLDGPSLLSPGRLGALRLEKLVFTGPEEALSLRSPRWGTFPLRVGRVEAPPGLVVKRRPDGFTLRGWWKKGASLPVRFTAFWGESLFALSGIEVRAWRPFPAGKDDPWRLVLSGEEERLRGVEPSLSGDGAGFLDLLRRRAGGKKEAGVPLSWTLLPPRRVREEGGWVSLDLGFRWSGWRFLSPLEEALGKPLVKVKGRTLALAAEGKPSLGEVFGRGAWMGGRFHLKGPSSSFAETLAFPRPPGGLEVVRAVLEPSPGGKVLLPVEGEDRGGVAGGLSSPGKGEEALGLALFLLALLWGPLVSFLGRAAAALSGGEGGRAWFPGRAYAGGFLLAFACGFFLVLSGRAGASAPFFIFSLYMLAFWIPAGDQP